MKKQNVRTLSLIVVTFTYLLIGAAVFDYLESQNERLSAIILKKMEGIWRTRYDISDEDYLLLETVVLRGVPHKAGQQWKFAGAFYYATTVLTTIGYGHSTPNTVPGKIFTICYAMVGIPLCLVLFHSIGERLNKVSSLVVRNIKKLFKCANKDATEVDLIIVVTTLSTITITSGAAVFSSYENWTYFDSVYYCVITLTTIGFGDMVALQKNEALKTQPEYVAFSLVFILFGMAIVAASLNLFVLRFVTMNTEDERRDEAEALQAAAGAVRLEGDVITANESMLAGECGVNHPPEEGVTGSLTELASVCSCTCVSCNPFPPSGGLIARNRYSIRKRSVPVPRYHPQGANRRSSQSYRQGHLVRHTDTQEEICSVMSEYEDGSSVASVESQMRNSVLVLWNGREGGHLEEGITGGVLPSIRSSSSNSSKTSTVGRWEKWRHNQAKVVVEKINEDNTSNSQAEIGGCSDFLNLNQSISHFRNRSRSLFFSRSRERVPLSFTDNKEDGDISPLPNEESVHTISKKVDTKPFYSLEKLI